MTNYAGELAVRSLNRDGYYRTGFGKLNASEASGTVGVLGQLRLGNNERNGLFLFIGVPNQHLLIVEMLKGIERRLFELFESVDRSTMRK